MSELREELAHEEGQYKALAFAARLVTGLDPSLTPEALAVHTRVREKLLERFFEKQAVIKELKARLQEEA